MIFLNRGAFFLTMALLAFVAIPVLGQSSSIHWSDDGSRIWFVNHEGQQKQFVVVDVESREKYPAFDHAEVAKSLSQQLDREVDPKNLPINELIFGDSKNDWLILCGKDCRRRC